VIAYFDTSAILPLLIEEPTSERSGALWDESDRLVGVPLLYAEARAALAQAERTSRLSGSDLRVAVAGLSDLYVQIDRVAVTEGLVSRAGELAERHGLRGYDAVHLAAALLVADAELVFVTGDRSLRRAAVAAGLATANLDLLL
jgi:uncharacterized protein